jgi:DNA-binding NtrC family response regulator
MSTVLVVDDKEMLRDSVGATLARAGLTVEAAGDGPAALSAIARSRPDCVVTDLKMPGMDGLGLIEAIRTLDEDLPVVLMTAFGTIETAVRAIKLGAFDYVTKPFEGDELLITVKRAVQHGQLVRENAVLRTGAGAGSARAASGAELVGLHRLVGDSPAMRRVKEQVLAVAESAGTVLICGESGTGKEVVARAIHELSPRDRQAFLGVNCAALSDTLLESELFGHEKGAFTGADKVRKGRFELADRGTLLLDEISEVPPRVQAKLLRVLQERVLERVGSSTSIGVDVRVIATSNRDLPKSVAKGEFRQDLFFRLNVLPVHLPPLRDRAEDIVPLAEHFLRQISLRDGKPLLRLSEAAAAAMTAYSWPGNVRELQNICERAAVLARGECVGPELIRPWLGQGLAVPAGPAQPLSVAQAREGAREGAREAEATAVEMGSEAVVHAGAAGTAPWLNGHGHLNGHANVHGGLNGLERGLAGPAGAGGAWVGGYGHVEVKPGAGASVSTERGLVGAASVAGGGGSGEVVAISNRALEDIERDAIVNTLRRFNGHRQRTAQALGIGVRTLGLKLKKWKSLSLIEESL